MQMQQTSIEAYFSVLPNLSEMQSKVFNQIKNRGMCICDDLEIDLGMSHQSCSACINALVKKGLVKDSGYKGVTRSGRKAIKWQIDWEGDKNANAKNKP